MRLPAQLPDQGRPWCRAVLKGAGGGVEEGNESSQGRSLLRGQDMGKTENRRNGVEQWLAVGGGWRLAVGGWWSLGAVLNEKRTALPWRRVDTDKGQDGKQEQQQHVYDVTGFPIDALLCRGGWGGGGIPMLEGGPQETVRPAA